MKRLYLIIGLLLIGTGLFVTYGTILIILEKSYSSDKNLTYWSLAGLLPFIIGVLLWFKSGEMKWGKTTWFFVGFILSWMLWSIISSIRLRPQDLTQSISNTERSFYDKNSTWVKSSIARHIGRFCFFAANDKTASALLKLHNATIPYLIIEGSETNGSIDSIIVGNIDQSISVNFTNNGIIKEYSITTGGSNSTPLVDGNMDGQYDFRISPIQKKEVNINSNWYQRIYTNGQFFIKLDGVEKQIIRTNGLWQLRE